MYLSFMLATSRSGKKQFLKKREKKTMKKTVIAVKKCSLKKKIDEIFDFMLLTKNCY